MRNQIVSALLAHAQGDIQKHKMNVEVYLKNPVGIGEHHQDQYNTDLYGYLVRSLCDPEEQSIINYINNNRHNPDRDYNLSYIYSSTLASKNGNFN